MIILYTPIQGIGLFTFHILSWKKVLFPCIIINEERDGFLNRNGEECQVDSLTLSAHHIEHFLFRHVEQSETSFRFVIPDLIRNPFIPCHSQEACPQPLRGKRESIILLSC